MSLQAAQSGFDATKFALAYPDGIERHYWTRARNRVIEHQLRRARLKEARIVEVGCGRGVVVDHLRHRGYKCFGAELATVDPLDSVRPYVFTGLEAAELPIALRKSCRAVLLLDVIEHVPDPIAFLRTIASAFPDLSHVVVTVPARNELWSNYDEFYGHERRYNLESLRQTMTASGGHVEDLRYFFRLLYYPARWVVARGAKRAVKLKAPGRAARVLHHALARLFFLDYLLLPKEVPGTSLVCRARLGSPP